MTYGQIRQESKPSWSEKRKARVLAAMMMVLPILSLLAGAAMAALHYGIL